MASMALLVLKPTAVAEVAFSGGGVEAPWREYLKQVCGIVTAGAGVLTLTGLATPTK